MTDKAYTTPRQPVSEATKRRRAINRAMWRAETKARGPRAGVYSPRSIRYENLLPHERVNS